jgi:hypothetical protein
MFGFMISKLLEGRVPLDVAISGTVGLPLGSFPFEEIPGSPIVCQTRNRKSGGKNWKWTNSYLLRSSLTFIAFLNLMIKL